jgi:DHA2 family multidrug resistance protein
MTLSGRAVPCPAALGAYLSMTSATSIDTRKEENTEAVNPYLKWIIAITVAVGAMLEVIDTSIVNVALKEMQGNLGATLSEIGWVVTAYGIANAVMIPLSAWLGDYFGKKRYWIFSLIGFTLASILCGMATNLSFLVFARILQGLFGGGLLAKASAILFETFPPAEQGLAQAVFGIAVVVGPVIGPTLGGYITDTLGWRWIFFINIPVGIIAVLMSMAFLQKMHQNEVSAHVDFIGIALLILSIGSLQTMLEQGQDKDWFSSRFIVALAITAIVSSVLFVWRELTVAYPAVDLRVLKHKSLWSGSLYSAILGGGLYGAMFAVPIFAQSFLQYTAMQTGLMLMPGAIATACMMPILGRLNGKVDARLLIAFGAIGTAICMFMLSSINPQSSSDSMFWALILRGMAMAFMFLPMTLAAIGPLPKKDIAAASGFFNLTRQLGGSIGVAGITAVLVQREAFHRQVLIEHVTAFSTATQTQLAMFTQMFIGKGFDQTTATKQAYAMIDRMVNQQAAVMSFADIFWIVGVIFILSMLLLFFLGSGKGTSGAVEPSH